MGNGMTQASVLAAAEVVRRGGHLDNQKKIMVSQIEDMLSRTDALEELVRAGDTEQRNRVLLGIDLLERDLQNLRQRVLMLEVA